MRVLLVCLGGALGTGARYLLSGWAARHLGLTFPYGTLTVNVLGSFLMCFLMTLMVTTHAVRTSPEVRLFLTTGVLGGFTTYSAFTYESLALLQERAWLSLGLNLSATVLGCLVAGLLGLMLARALAGA